jgi:hypothetical protein
MENLEPREREREREYERDLPIERERPRERPREREYERDDRERDHHRQFGRDTIDVVRDAAVPAAGAAIDKRRSERKYDSDEERSRRSRHDPNDREDERERRYAERDREEKRRDDKPREAVIDPDEEYRRRIQQAQVELEGLSMQRSKDDERSDSDREKQRRREREERDRERRQSRDRDSRRESDENNAPPKVARSQARGSFIDSQADQRHNRLPTDRSITGEFVEEPDSIPRGYSREPSQATAGVMPPPSPAVKSTLPPPDVAPRSKSADPNASISSSERRVTIVEPPKEEKIPDPPLKGILRKPTEKFPEHPNPTREGVTPLKDRLKKEGGGKDIPEGAKWTKIDRRLVNPQALEEKGERFEERQDYVIVLRVLTKDEIQEFANRTADIRG